MNKKDFETEQLKILGLIKKVKVATPHKMTKIIAENSSKKNFYTKAELLEAYRKFVKAGRVKQSVILEKRLQTKPIRSLSGVSPVTVLTKPYPCPGNCIYCPSELDMPKSYLESEPGAMRAKSHKFNPYNQVKARIEAFVRNGHETDKIELLILGGTWSYYKRDYQDWFIKRCFDAMNGKDSKDLVSAQRLNEKSKHRNVGLVVETRPDYIDEKEIINLRRLGVTKVQIGIQSIRDNILKMNKRGETRNDQAKAIRLLRLGGFKIVIHWMPNLYGATFDSDLEDYKELWKSLDYKVDELKIYPCSVLKNTELYNLSQSGEYHPYSKENLVNLLALAKTETPRYTRLNRIIRDIPSKEIVIGNKVTNLRQVVKAKMDEQGLACNCIRCREIRGEKTQDDELVAEDIVYDTSCSREYFLTYKTKKTDKIAGFLRLSIPNEEYRNNHFIKELQNSSMIREVHVYGISLKLGDNEKQGTQHLGIGKNLIKRAIDITKENGITKINVISAVGTREYYRKLGFSFGDLYMSKKLLQ